MVFEKFRYFCESQGLRFFAIEGRLRQDLGGVASALVLGKDVPPQFLVFAHELEHSFAVAIFFLLDLHKHKWLSPLVLLLGNSLVPVLLLGQ